MTTDEVKRSQGRRLAELRKGYPSDSTLENLLSVLQAELDLCARLPVFVYEATSEGDEECASLLSSLADTERAHVERVLAALQRHLERRGTRTEASR